MKECPKCRRTFADEALSFCLDDGSLLSASRDYGATLPHSNNPNTNAPTRLFSPGAKQHNSRLAIYVGGVALIAVVGLVIFFLTRTSYEKTMLGTWSVSSHISPAEAAKLSDEPVPSGVSMEGSETGSITYHEGGKYNQESEAVFRLRKDEKEISLKLTLREAGDWVIHSGTLVETITDASVFASDDFTKNFLEQAPQIKEGLSPVKGTSTSYKLNQVSDSKVILEDKENGITTVLQKKTSF